ncbi:hypothetical protein I3760_08G029000 [Carya illinoinensis]|nr:hypothetical protein I3760_08G029000 [Carya illinoinensis]
MSPDPFVRFPSGLLGNKLNNLTRTSNGPRHLMVLITSQEWYLSLEARRWRRCRRRFAGKEVVTRWHLIFSVNYIVHDGVNLFYASMWRLRWRSNLGKWMIAKALRGAFSWPPLSTGLFKLWG